MDDQAIGLRQLVRHVRHAALVSTGPPCFLLLAADERTSVEPVARLLQAAAQQRGVRVAATPGEIDERADWILTVLDHTGSCFDSSTRQRASGIVLVASTHDDSILAAYKSLKLAARENPLPAVELVFRTDDDEHMAHGLYERFRGTCQQYLNCSEIQCNSLSVKLDTPARDEPGIAKLIDRLLLLAPVNYCALTPLASQQEIAV